MRRRQRSPPPPKGHADDGLHPLAAENDAGAADHVAAPAPSKREEIVDAAARYAIETLLSVLLAVLTISLWLFLDHRGVFPTNHARVFRSAMQTVLLQDPEAVAAMGEGGMEIMMAEEYQSKLLEISSAPQTIAELEATLQTRAAEAAKRREEIAALKPTHDELYNHPLLEMGKYCGECIWLQKSTCDNRVTHLQDQYNTGLLAARISAMKKASCKRG